MLNKIKEIIDKYKKVTLSAHISPDGDALGSVIAFKYMIEKYDKNKEVEIVIQDNLPNYMKKFKEKEFIKKEYGDIELLIMLDTANIDRAAIDKKAFEIAKDTINIDHHISNSKYLNNNYIEYISSTSELIFKFLDIFNIDLDKNIATFIYLGIINDTGNFRHSNVTDNTFLIASKLMEVGIDNRFITNALYSKSMVKSRVFGDVFLNFEYYNDIKFGFYFISKDKMNKFNIIKDDTDGISEALLSIEDVEVSLFLREEDDGSLKGSFRSKKIDVNKLASIFSGGGHILAAGFKTRVSKDEILNKIISEMRNLC